jgi:hypothetical protein
MGLSASSAFGPQFLEIRNIPNITTISFGEVSETYPPFLFFSFHFSPPANLRKKVERGSKKEECLLLQQQFKNHQTAFCQQRLALAVP